MTAQEHLKELLEEIESRSNEQIGSEFEGFIQIDLSPAEAKSAVLYTEKLLNHFESVERKQIKSDFEDLCDSKYDLSPTEIAQTILNIEQLSDQLESVGRNEIKSEFESLLQYSVPPDEAKASMKRRYRKRLTTDEDSDAVSDQSTKTSSDSNSDYQLQREGQYPENWDVLRRQAYNRDDYYCQNCGVGGGPSGDAELHAHHIVPISDGGNNTLSNLSTLCVTCHGLIHDHMG